MDFEFTEAENGIRERVRAFCDRHCDRETIERLEAEATFPEELYGAMANAGILGVSLPAAVGGDEAGITGAVLVTEELARVSTTLVNLYLVNAVFAGALIAIAGTDRQRAELLPALAKGKLRLAFALTERAAGSDAAAIETTASRTDTGWSLSGSKRYTTGALDADKILVVARSDTEHKASRGTSVFIVPASTDGLTVTLMNKVAGNAYASCELELDGVQVPEDAVLGGEDGLHGAWSALRVLGGMERVCVAASALGLSRSVLSDAREHATTRRQFGQPIGEFQAISHRLADMAIAIEAMQWLTYVAAWKADRGEDAGKEISIAKAYAAETVNRLVLDGLGILGGEGFLSNTPMARYQREALLSLYAGGTTEIQKNLIGRYMGLS